MSLREFLSGLTDRELIERPRDRTGNKYPIYDSDFFYNLTWRCSDCGIEFYQYEDDDQLTCHNCDTQYSLRKDNFPELLRAKCWNCGHISDANGFRAENIVFDCPHCPFEWKSSPW